MSPLGVEGQGVHPRISGSRKRVSILFLFLRTSTEAPSRIPHTPRGTPQVARKVPSQGTAGERVVATGEGPSGETKKVRTMARRGLMGTWERPPVLHCPKPMWLRLAEDGKNSTNGSKWDARSAAELWQQNRTMAQACDVRFLLKEGRKQGKEFPQYTEVGVRVYNKFNPHLLDGSVEIILHLVSSRDRATISGETLLRQTRGTKFN